VNNARLKVLGAREAAVSSVLETGLARLPDLANGAGYKAMLEALIMQGLVSLQASEAAVRCREADTAAVRAAIPSVVKRYAEATRVGTCDLAGTCMFD
jgi:vacuolar-type H+-ATPase subunit E/Vma4